MLRSTSRYFFDNKICKKYLKNYTQNSMLLWFVKCPYGSLTNVMIINENLLIYGKNMINYES